MMSTDTETGLPSPAVLIRGHWCDADAVATTRPAQSNGSSAKDARESAQQAASSRDRIPRVAWNMEEKRRARGT